MEFRKTTRLGLTGLALRDQAVKQELPHCLEASVAAKSF
jgi:hypothetical protein